MVCTICKNDFNIKRTILNFFDTKEYFICDKCLKMHPFNLEFNTIPLDNHSLEIISLFKKKPTSNIAFIREESIIYQKLIETKKEHQIIFCDTFCLNDYSLAEYNEISKNLNKDILILTQYYKVKE